MTEERNYYEKIQSGLQNFSGSEEAVKAINTLCRICQQYYHKYLIREKMKSAEQIFKNDFDETEYMAQRKLDMYKDKRLRFTVSEKLYLEFMGEIYDKYYANEMKYDELINSLSFDENIAKCFKIVPTQLINKLTDIMEIISKYSEVKEYDPLISYIYERHNFSYIHNAMNVIKDALKLPVPAIELSVEKVIVQDKLEMIVNYLMQDNIAGALFTAAKMTRALSEGKCYSYTSMSGHSVVCLNYLCEYNLKEMEKRIESIKNFVESYDKEMEKLNKYREMFI